MAVEAAHRLDMDITVLDKAGNPASRLGCSTVEGEFKGETAESGVLALARSGCHVLTVEIEHIDTQALDRAQQAFPHLQIHPAPATLRIIQDKFLQKQRMAEMGIPLSEFVEVEAAVAPMDALSRIGLKFGYPFMLKTKRLAYDGRGNFVVKTPADIPRAIMSLVGSRDSGSGNELYAEKFVEFTKELAVMVVKGHHTSSPKHNLASYPVVETIQRDNICHLVIAPAQVDGLIAEKAQQLALKAVTHLEGSGIYGVEMFLLKDGSVVLNEIAPRPHNSGHYTIEATHTSQFEQHIRAISGMPLGSTDMKVGASCMINILGNADGEEGMSQVLKICADSMSLPGATVHLYGKRECRKGRKMGHITIVGDSMTEVLNNTRTLLNSNPSPPTPTTTTSQSTIPSSSADTDPSSPISSLDIPLSPIVGIIMGSDSDLPTLKPAAEILKSFSVPFEISIVSAHRTPERMMEYSKTAHERGIKIIIAAAGGAAHLPGMVAAITPLPVIGVPVALKYLDGMDSLYSIVQMPRGVPVATVAINNSTNAALLAIRILGSHIPMYQRLLQDYQNVQKEQVLIKVYTLDTVGWEKYGEK